MPNRDTAARALLVSAWPKYGAPSPAALQAAQAIAHVESGGGYGAVGTSDPLWAGSNNWGAIKCPSSAQPCADGCFSHTDTDGQGKASLYCFRSYATPADGAAGFLYELMRRPAVRAALPSGSSTAIAQAMARAPAYMALSPVAYGRLIAARAAIVAKAVGEPLYVTQDGPGSSSSSAAFLLVAGFLGWLEVEKRKLRRRRR